MPQFRISVSKNGKPYVRRVMTKYMRGKYSERGKLRWQDPEFQKMMRYALARRPNNFESDFFEEIVKIISGLSYTGDNNFFVKEKNPDFVIFEGEGQVTKCIDLFGDYWHKGEDPSGRIAYFKNEGFNLLIIWEHEWNVDRGKVIDRIRDWMPLPVPKKSNLDRFLPKINRKNK